MSNRIDKVDAGDGRAFDAYVSLPDKPNGNAIVILQEIFGVTKHVRAVADKWAAEGYLAIAPDLFWRAERNVELTHSKEDLARAFGFLKSFDEAKGVDDVVATALHVRASPAFGGRVAVAGLCLGGKLAYLAAMRPQIDAAVAFYGVGIEKSLAEAKSVCKPLMMHFGEADTYVSPESRNEISTALEGKSDVSMHVYPGADHGFYTRGSPENIALAHERSKAFLEQSLAAAK